MNGIPALAQTVQSQGRGKDTQLVHMTPNEVAGLQSLAMAHGGSLSINPGTGLPEAGFLDNILPTLAGAALTIGSGGAINPWMAAGIVGGVTGAASGSLEKGLMAGLGAYGGAGLGGGLSAAGATTVNPATSALPANSVVAPYAPLEAGLSPATSTAGAGAGAGISGVGNQAYLNQMGGFSQAATPSMGGLTGSAADMSALANTNVPANSIGANFSQAGRGLESLGSEAGRSEFMKGVGGGFGLTTSAGAALAPSLLSQEGGGPEPSPGTVRPYKYDAGRQDVAYRTGAPGESTAEQAYFKPSYTALTPYIPGSGSAAEQEDMRRRGIMGLAAGSQGPVRMLRGGGDATSDSMDGMIDGEEPVKLATGEVVIDGRAVSEIGNGDNESGAKKIEAAINRIHKIRQKAARGKPSNADKTFASMIA